MTLTEVYQLMLQEESDLASMSYYDHIEVDEGAEVFPPFIIFKEVGGRPFHADDQVYYLTIDNEINLYTSDRSPLWRSRIIDFLNRHSLPFTLDMSDFDADTGLYVDTFNLILE